MVITDIGAPAFHETLSCSRLMRVDVFANLAVKVFLPKRTSILVTNEERLHVTNVIFTL